MPLLILSAATFLSLQDTMLSQQQMANIDATTDVSEKEFTRRVSNLKVDSSLLKPLKLDASDSTSAMETAEKIAGWVEKGVEPASDVIEVRVAASRRHSSHCVVTKAKPLLLRRSDAVLSSVIIIALLSVCHRHAVAGYQINPRGWQVERQGS